MKSKSNQTIVFAFLLILTFSISSSAQSGPYLGQDPPGLTPKLFVPNYLMSNSDWWWHGGIDFISNGREMFLDIYCPAELGGIRIRYMKLINGEWTIPESAPFSSSSQYADASPSFIDNGHKVIFISDRPNGYYGSFWSTTRSGSIWSNPQPVYVPWLQSLSSGWGMTLSNNETIYTQLIDNNSNTDFDLYRIRKVNGQYLLPERLDNNINSSYMEMGAFIDPDERYIIFESNRPSAAGFSDLYISFKNSEGNWTQAINMGEPINSDFEDGSPYVSSDYNYFFFLSDRNGSRNPYWVDAEIINGFISGIREELINQIPDNFKLSQNYPNPFNPSTTIMYELNKTAHVKLIITNVLGEIILEAVDEIKNAGVYEYQFNATNLSSGIYFYQLTAGNYWDIKKMLLIQ